MEVKNENRFFLIFIFICLYEKLQRSKNNTYVPQHEISNNVICATSKDSDQPAHKQNLIRAFAGRLNILLVLSY